MVGNTQQYVEAKMNKREAYEKISSNIEEVQRLVKECEDSSDDSLKEEIRKKLKESLTKWPGKTK